jgi:hypothetical protein|tara:strand:- start:634 stop:810 length:177 start_codon:yes stop_codon:yes gene_type:complete
MSPEYQTLLTLACMGGTYFWAHHHGRLAGIRDTLLFLEKNGDLTIEEEIIEIEDDEDE